MFIGRVVLCGIPEASRAEVVMTVALAPAVLVKAIVMNAPEGDMGREGKAR